MDAPTGSRERKQLQDRSPEHGSQTTSDSDTVRRSRGKPPRWYRIYPFRGMWRDVSRRAPYYWSDFKDAWDYRVVPATVYIFFANVLPALAFSLDMFDKTDSSYGVNEVLLASVLGAVVFSLFSCQPLTIVGVTGPITVFTYTVYELMVPTGTNFFPFMAVIGIWAAVFHWILAVTNSCNALRHVTRFSCDTFGFYVATIYLQYGVQTLVRQYPAGAAETYLSMTVALLVFIIGMAASEVGNTSLFHRVVRKFVEDYATPLTIIFMTGFVHIGYMRATPLQTLPVTRAFFPTKDRGWFVDFWDIRPYEVGIALPFALILTILFWFDHNVSSLIAQGTEFPLKKPAGFHWDIFLLGCTTLVAGFLGIPFPNGLIPQAPFHTSALCVTGLVPEHAAKKSEESAASQEGAETSAEEDPQEISGYRRVTTRVVEQRVSNLAQGLATVVLMTGPLLVVLHLIPRGVLAGLFWLMGVQALVGNGITRKLVFLAQERALVSPGIPLARIRRRAVWGFVGCALFFYAGALAVTETIAAIGFPIVLLLPIPFRALVMPRFFSVEELDVLDAGVCSPFTLESVAGVSKEERRGEGDVEERGEGSGFEGGRAAFRGARRESGSG